MSEMKATLNIRVSSDLNVSFTFTNFTDGTADAEAFGSSCADMVQAWLHGYAQTSPTEEDA